MVKINPVKVSFSVPERYAQNVQLGMKVDFSLEGVAETFTGTIYAKDPTINPNTRTQEVKAKSPNPKGKLLPGSYARIRL